MISDHLLDFMFEINKELSFISQEIPALNNPLQENESIAGVFTRKKKLMKKVINALKEDLTKEIKKANEKAPSQLEPSVQLQAPVGDKLQKMRNSRKSVNFFYHLR